jgi:CBS domain-containing protein
MTTEPVIMGPEASIAEALALVRREELATALATTVFVCRHRSRRRPAATSAWSTSSVCCASHPHAPIGGILDKDVEPLTPTRSLGQVTRMLATYDLVGLPVVDDESGALLGAVTVDDVLDHILPEDWREDRHEPDQEHPEVAHG